jgi:hypothetical protein
MKLFLRCLVFSIGAVLIAACLIFLYSISDEHRSVTAQMGWACVLTEGTGSPKFPHVEIVKMWFLQNPHFEERASGPHLCQDLKASGQDQIAVTFDVWGNKMRGLHGYDGAGISVQAKQLQIYEFGSGGFHGDASIGNYNSADHPEVYRFPLDVFK